MRKPIPRLPVAQNHRDRMCTDKHVFLTRDEAVRSAKRLRKRLGKEAQNVRQYRCRYCNLWHIGHGGDVVQGGR